MSEALDPVITQAGLPDDAPADTRPAAGDC
jgi:hypothetical protein